MKIKITMNSGSVITMETNKYKNIRDFVKNEFVGNMELILYNLDDKTAILVRNISIIEEVKS